MTGTCSLQCVQSKQKFISYVKMSKSTTFDSLNFQSFFHIWHVEFIHWFKIVSAFLSMAKLNWFVICNKLAIRITFFCFTIFFLTVHKHIINWRVHKDQNGFASFAMRPDRIIIYVLDYDNVRWFFFLSLKSRFVSLFFSYFPRDLFVAHMNFLLLTGKEIEKNKRFRQYCYIICYYICWCWCWTASPTYGVRRIEIEALNKKTIWIHKE